MTAENGIYEVVSPVGKPSNDKINALPKRISDLNGKTVCQVWHGRFQADTLFAELNVLLKKRFPDIKIIPCTDMPVISFYRDQDKKLEDLKEAYLQKECDAVITGIGA